MCLGHDQVPVRKPTGCLPPHEGGGAPGQFTCLGAGGWDSPRFSSAGPAGPSGDARLVSEANRERLEPEAVNKAAPWAAIIHGRNERPATLVSG
jgi:hypothetical protein